MNHEQYGYNPETMEGMPPEELAMGMPEAQDTGVERYEAFLTDQLANSIEQAKQAGYGGVEALEVAEQDLAVVEARKTLEDIFHAPETRESLKQLEKDATEMALDRTGIVIHEKQEVAEASTEDEPVTEIPNKTVELQAGQKLMVNGVENTNLEQAKVDQTDVVTRNDGLRNGAVKRASAKMFDGMKRMGIKTKISGRQQEAWAGAVLATKSETVNHSGGDKSLDVPQVAVIEHGINEVLGEELAKAMANGKLTQEGRDQVYGARRSSTKFNRNLASAVKSYQSSGKISQGTARQLGRDIRANSNF